MRTATRFGEADVAGLRVFRDVRAAPDAGQALERPVTGRHGMEATYAKCHQSSESTMCSTPHQLGESAWM